MPRKTTKKTTRIEYTEVDHKDFQVNEAVLGLIWHLLYDIKNQNSYMELFGTLMMEHEGDMDKVRDSFAKAMIQSHMSQDKRLAKELIKSGIVTIK